MKALHSLHQPGGARRTTTASATAMLMLAAGLANAQTPEAPAASAHPVVVVVKVPTPWYAPKALVASKMRDTIPTYERIDGLNFKVFSMARESGDFGGIYHWLDKGAAQRWFTPQWFERVRQERGNAAVVRYFDAPLTVDNTPGGTPANTDSKGVATVVEIAVPAGVSRERLIEEFKAAAPTYQKVPGLLRKHFTISDTGAFGGIYIWRDEASARAWFSPSWYEQVRTRYGREAKMEWFDTPVLLPTRLTVTP